MPSRRRFFINGVFEENIHAAKQSERKLRTVFSHRAEPGTWQNYSVSQSDWAQNSFPMMD